MSRSSLRYRTATFPRSPAKFSSMVNIRSSLKLHRRSKTQGDSEGGQGNTLPRTPVPITTNIEEEEEEEEEENEAIRAEVRAAEAKKTDLSHERGSGDIDAEKVAQAVAAEAISQGDANSFHGDERGELAEEDGEEKEEVEKIDVNDDETVSSEDIVMENSSEANMEVEFNQPDQMQDEKEEEEDVVSDDEESLQNQRQPIVRELSVNLSNGSSNGYKAEALEEEEEESEDESVEDSMLGTTVTLLDDDNLSALRPVSVTRHSSTISNELGILAEEEEEEESDGGQISFTAQTSNPFDGLEDGKEKEEGSLSKASSKRSVHFDHGEFIFTNGKTNGMLESHFGYDDKKNPFMDTFDDS